jgi:hypothetical protein
MDEEEDRIDRRLVRTAVVLLGTGFGIMTINLLYTYLTMGGVQ